MDSGVGFAYGAGAIRAGGARFEHRVSERKKASLAACAVSGPTKFVGGNRICARALDAGGRLGKMDGPDEPGGFQAQCQWEMSASDLAAG
jgi:hypothetical protein